MIPADLEILEHGLIEAVDARGRATGHVQSLWFHNREVEAGQSHDMYRVARLYLLRYLPQESRQDPAFLDKMRTILTGLYTQHRAQFDLITLLAGMWQPDPIGIMQVYGIVGWGASLEDATHQAHLGSEALLGALANFTQAVLEPLPRKYALWLEAAFRTKLCHAKVPATCPPRPQPKPVPPDNKSKCS